MKAWQYGLQALNYLAFIVTVGYFSFAPSYQPLEDDEAIIVLAFGHSGQHVGECVRKTPEELAKLPPNLRVPLVCPRERSPIDIEMALDEKIIFKKTVQAPGFSKDGGIDVYQRFRVPAEEHTLKLRLRDSVKVEDYNYVHDQRITLLPRQVLVIDFTPELGGFIVK